MTDCTHVGDTFYYACVNEDGWKCVGCDTTFGFRPDLDRELTVIKVHGLLMDFHESKLIYISNGTMGEIIAENVAARCFAENFYDQEHVLRFILEDPNMRPDSTFWQTRAERWLLGAEPIRQEQEALPFA
jgi:hypothetical protein